MGTASGTGDARTHPAPQEEQTWALLLNCIFLSFPACVLAFSAGFLGEVCTEAAAWLICFVNGAARGAAEGIGEVEGATYLGFHHLGGLLLPRLSGCGKWKMKGAAFPASRVTMSKAEKGGWGKRGGGSGCYRETWVGKWPRRGWGREGGGWGRAARVSHHVRAEEFPLLWGCLAQKKGEAFRLAGDE